MELNTFYRFKVRYYDEINKEEKTEHGFVFGATYADCLKQLVDFYGEDQIFSMELKILNESVLIVPEGIADYIEDEMEHRYDN